MHGRLSGFFVAVTFLVQILVLSPASAFSVGLQSFSLQTKFGKQNLFFSPARAQWRMSANVAAESEPLVLTKLAANGLGILNLNRPKALNAANKEMTWLLLDQLIDWESKDTAKAFVIKSTSNRALCSGGDVKALAASLQENPASTLLEEALSNEYRLVHAISTSKIPSVAIMDGVTMGFGVGMSGFCRFRIVTERTLFAMPENVIALFPDVAFAHLTRHMPSVSKFLALTGTKLGGKFSPTSDLLYCGLGTHFVESSKLGDLALALEAAELRGDAEAALSEAVGRFATEPQEESRLKKMRGVIDACFGPEVSTAGAAREAMERAGEEAEAEVKAALEAAVQGMQDGCPFTMCATMHHQHCLHSDKPPEGLSASTVSDQLTRVCPGGAAAGDEQVAGVLGLEYRAMVRLARRGDFAEGVRARLVDKDNTPRWSPGSVAEVSPGEVAACFAPLPEGEELQLRKRARSGEGPDA